MLRTEKSVHTFVGFVTLSLKLTYMPRSPNGMAAVSNKFSQENCLPQGYPGSNPGLGVIDHAANFSCIFVCAHDMRIFRLFVHIVKKVDSI